MYIALGIGCSILIMAGMYALSMYGYFKLRQKKSASKFGVEIAVLSFAVLFSIVIKGVIIFISEDARGNFWQSMSNTFKAVYSGIGGLTFEGLSDFEQDIVSSILQCLYAGSSLYAGIMILSVLTAKISYEIYSAIRKLFGFNAKMKKGNTDFYIFDAVTEESITLANSVSDYYASDKTTRECEILFIGPNLDSFDSKEELHREVMAHGYYYWSYSEKPNDLGVLDYLKLPVVTDFFKDKPNQKDSETRIHFFAMSANEKLSGLESANSSAVFKEIRTLANKMIQVKTLKDGNREVCFERAQVTDFYVLTDNDINYEFYKRELLSIISEVCEQKNVVLQDYVEYFKNLGFKFEENDLQDDRAKANKVIRCISCYFQLHIINEADIAAKRLTVERKNVFLKKETLQEKNFYVNDLVGDLENNFRVMVLGFGTNGQQSMKYLYRSTACVNGEKVPTRFIADVYDPQTAFSAGLFGFNHPMFICVDKGSVVDAVEQNEWADEEKHVKLMFKDEVVKKYYDETCEKLNEYAKPEGVDEEEWNNCKNIYLSSAPQTLSAIENNLIFPVVAFHKISAFEDGFLKYLDKGVEGNCTIKSRYKAFIIAMGKDELNITMANSLIADLMHEYALSGNKSFPTKTIYVNLRDRKNYNRINWSALSEQKMPYLKVVPYGASEDMFSYETIVNDNQSTLYNYSYSMVAEKLKDDAHKVILNCKGALLDSIIDKIDSGVDYNTQYYEIRKSWLTLDSFRQQSNYAVNDFSSYYKVLYDIFLSTKTKITNEQALSLSAVEHERWLRFHVANGWFFNPVRCDQIKEHNCICPFNMLKVSSIVYDLMNVAVSMERSKGAKNG